MTTQHQQWEYKIEIPEGGFASWDLNDLGGQGWELCAAYVQFNKNFYIFKRPKQ